MSEREKAYNKPTWGWRELVLLVIFVAFLTAKWWAGFIPGIFDNVYASGNFSFVLKTISTICVFLFYHEMLKESWKAFKSKLWRNLLLAVACFAAMHALLFITRRLPFFAVAPTGAGDAEEDAQTVMWFVLLMSLVPAQAPFLEELLFRHNLFFRFRKNAVLLPLMCLFSAFLFGFAHINNFNGNIKATIPYMVVGLFLNLIYLWKKNIWNTLAPHLIFNAVNSLLPALFLFILSLFGIMAN